MTTMLENFVFTHPDVTLSHTLYGQHFYLGSGVNILSSPNQRIQSYVENEGSPYRFLIVGQLKSFKVVEDAVRLVFIFLSNSLFIFLRIFYQSSASFFQSTLASFNPLRCFQTSTEVRSPH
jgi:hypothetical protein